VNFLRRLSVEGGGGLYDSSRLDVVEIARFSDMLLVLVSFLVGLRTYQHPGICSVVCLVFNRVFFIT